VDRYVWTQLLVHGCQAGFLGETASGPMLQNKESYGRCISFLLDTSRIRLHIGGQDNVASLLLVFPTSFPVDFKKLVRTSFPKESRSVNCFIMSIFSNSV
jgi:hypothetical protein